MGGSERLIRIPDHLSRTGSLDRPAVHGKSAIFDVLVVQVVVADLVLWNMLSARDSHLKRCSNRLFELPWQPFRHPAMDMRGPCCKRLFVPQMFDESPRKST